MPPLVLDREEIADICRSDDFLATEMTPKVAARHPLFSIHELSYRRAFNLREESFMRSLLRVAGIAVFCGLAATSSSAMFDQVIENSHADALHYFTGNKLRALGKSSLGFYVIGVVDRDLAIGNEPATGNPYCIPNGVNGEQLGDIVSKYLADNPAERQKAGAFLVRAALRQVFPCR